MDGHHHDRGGSEDQGSRLILHHNDHQSYYYVQSPSNAEFQSPVNDSSSRGSNAQYLPNLHAKKISYDAGSHDTELDNMVNHMIAAKKRHGCDDYLYEGKEGKQERWWKMYLSYTNSDSSTWICLQISWRFVLSLILALLVFYAASRPPPPHLSLQIERVGEFVLGEGVDESGVATKLLSCKATLNLTAENNSKIFGLHIHTPSARVSFRHFSFALFVSTGNKTMYASSGERMSFAVSSGTRNKAMYGAGREMDDMLDSSHGMPLLLHLRFTSSFPLLVGPKYYHHALCLLLLRRGYDQTHMTHPYNSTCTFT